MSKSPKSPKNTVGWLAFFSFVAVMLLGLALAISFTIGRVWDSAADIAGWIKNIAIAIALLVPLFYSYKAARRYGKTWFILWIIAVILIVVFYIWGIL